MTQIVGQNTLHFYLDLTNNDASATIGLYIEALHLTLQLLLFYLLILKLISSQQHHHFYNLVFPPF